MSFDETFKEEIKRSTWVNISRIIGIVVILGILVAIAVPSIGNIIENSKKDAHIANAHQLVNAAKLAMINGDNSTSFTIAQLKSGGYIDSIKDPSGENGATYKEDESSVTYDKSKKIYSVILKDKDSKTYININDVSQLTRNEVQIPPVE